MEFTLTRHNSWKALEASKAEIDTSRIFKENTLAEFLN